MREEYYGVNLDARANSVNGRLFAIIKYLCRRQCYFDSERKLRFLKVYTQRNCELECLANFTLAKWYVKSPIILIHYILCCFSGCVKFSSPRDANTLICGAAKLACYNRAEDNWLTEQFKKRSTLGVEKGKGCNCLPACTSISYDAEISQSPFDFVSMYNAFKSPLDEFPGYIFYSFQNIFVR